MRVKIKHKNGIVRIYNIKSIEDVGNFYNVEEIREYSSGDWITNDSPKWGLPIDDVISIEILSEDVKPITIKEIPTFSPKFPAPQACLNCPNYGTGKPCWCTLGNQIMYC